MESDTPLLHEVIVYFDIISGVLNEFIDDEDLPCVAQHAALCGMLMLNKYYALTDDTIVYCLAMSMSTIPFYLFY